MEQEDSPIMYKSTGNTFLMIEFLAVLNLFPWIYLANWTSPGKGKLEERCKMREKERQEKIHDVLVCECLDRQTDVLYMATHMVHVIFQFNSSCQTFIDGVLTA